MRTPSPQKQLGIGGENRRARATLRRCQFFRSTLTFCWGVLTKNFGGQSLFQLDNFQGKN